MADGRCNCKLTLPRANLACGVSLRKPYVLWIHRCCEIKNDGSECFENA